jgi:hypothetical protein
MNHIVMISIVLIIRNVPIPPRWFRFVIWTKPLKLGNKVIQTLPCLRLGKPSLRCARAISLRRRRSSHNNFLGSGSLNEDKTTPLLSLGGVDLPQPAKAETGSLIKFQPRSGAVRVAIIFMAGYKKEP